MSESATGEFSGKLVLVTGGSRGIGEAIVDGFVEGGGSVIATAATDEGLELINAKYDQEESSVLSARLDLLQEPDFEAFMQTTMESAGNRFDHLVASAGRLPLDVLVNNASVTDDDLLARLSRAQITDVIGTNLIGTILMTQAAMPYLKKTNNPSIVNVSSVSGAIRGNMGQTNYGAAKAGLLGFQRSLIQEHPARRGKELRINTVLPGAIKTRMTDVLSDEIKGTMAEHAALKRVGEPNEVASAVIFLASSRASFITGAELTVDGGLSV